MKKCLVIFFLLIINFFIPAYSDELDNLLMNNSKVILYVYTDDCRYCQQMAQKYDLIKKKYSNQFVFLKKNADTKEGNIYVRRFRIHYVPFIAIMKKNEKKLINPSCFANLACIDKILQNF